MKHLETFESYQYNPNESINEEINLSFLSPKTRLRMAYDVSSKESGKGLNDLVAAIDLTSIKNLFIKVCDILNANERIKNVQDLIQRSNVYTVDTMINCLKRLKKDLDENRKFIGSFTYDEKEKKFYYVSYYN